MWANPGGSEGASQEKKLNSLAGHQEAVLASYGSEESESLASDSGLLAQEGEEEGDE